MKYKSLVHIPVVIGYHLRRKNKIQNCDYTRLDVTNMVMSSCFQTVMDSILLLCKGNVIIMMASLFVC